jgi:hypothetical protein
MENKKPQQIFFRGLLKIINYIFFNQDSLSQSMFLHTPGLTDAA